MRIPEAVVAHCNSQAGVRCIRGKRDPCSKAPAPAAAAGYLGVAADNTLAARTARDRPGAG